MRCSVVICTRNRAESLRRTVRSVLEQRFDPFELELIVVDNRSSDHTRTVTESEACGSPFALRYVHEAELGLSIARNAGLRAARGDVVVFLDDDALPEKQDWASRLVEVYSESGVAAAGGDLEPVWPDGRRPEWLHTSLLPPLGLTAFAGGDAQELRYPNYPWGANISYRRSVLEQLDGFSEELGWGSSGEPIPGEESELCLRIEKLGKRILYVTGASVLHVIGAEKLTRDWLLRRAFAQGASEAVIDRMHERKLRRWSKVCARILALPYFTASAALSLLRKDERTELLNLYHARLSLGYLRRAVGFR